MEMEIPVSLETFYKTFSHHHNTPPPAQPMTDSDIALWKQTRGELYSYNVMATYLKKNYLKKFYKQETH